MTPNGDVKYVTKCRICGHEFKAAPFVAYLGDGIDPRMVGMQQTLQKHMMSDPAHQFYGAMVLAICSFQFQDPVILEFGELTRFAIQHTTRKNFASDEALLEKAQAFPADEVESAHNLLKDLRDFLTEQGEYAPNIQQSAAVVRT